MTWDDCSSDGQCVRVRGSCPPRLHTSALTARVRLQVTYPLDSLRLRLAVDPAVRSIPAAVRVLAREGGAAAFYRGLGPALCGIAPYMALELATYDSLPQDIPAFARGFSAALLATTCCYPLDTIRRRIQLQPAGVGVVRVVRDAWAKEGLRGFYRGFLPNALKNLPNKGARRLGPHRVESACPGCAAGTRVQRRLGAPVTCHPGSVVSRDVPSTVHSYGACRQCLHLVVCMDLQWRWA